MEMLWICGYRSKGGGETGRSSLRTVSERHDIQDGRRAMSADVADNSEQGKYYMRGKRRGDVIKEF